ncbi:MAG: ankyrin repeat domain-containing protein [Desulfobacterales bacterium]|jgi:ankyrin repeat protein
MDDNWFEKEQLHFAAQEGDLERAKELVGNGYGVNAFGEGLSFTPLHYAAENEHIEMMRFLLSVGVDVNACKEEMPGETPLGHVATRCSYEVAELLICAGANPTIPGWMQLTALYRASKRKKEEGKHIYKLLLVRIVRREGLWNV